MNLDKINWHDEANFFLNKLANIVNLDQFLKPYDDIDHICFRVSTDQEYFDAKESLLKISHFLIETLVNGRLISTFKLHNPIIFLDRFIDLIELPAPKINKIPEVGFEHIEIVTSSALIDLKTNFPHLVWNTSGLGKSFNPEIETTFSKQMNIKFHNLSLESVINIEKNVKKSSVLFNSKILENLSKNDPRWVGTIPLGIDTSDSDVDIIFCKPESDQFITQQVLQTALSSNWTLDKQSLNHLKFLTSSGLIEFYFENTPTSEQNGFVHFQIEEKILKYSNPQFKSKIQILKNQKVATEPAFANVLKIAGDPYIELYKMNSWPISKLKKFISEAGY